MTTRTTKTTKITRAFLAAAMVAFASDASANLLPNADFQSSLQGWTTTAETTWSPDDSDGSSSSGSVQIELGGVATSAITACVPATAGEQYEFGTDIRLVFEGNNVFGKAGLIVRWKSSPSCAGEDISFEGTTYSNFETDWTTKSGTATAPAGAVAALVELRATKSSGSGGSRLVANLDQAFLRVQGSQGSTTTLPGEPLTSCGDAVAPYGTITAADALHVLRASVNLLECDLCICDLNDSGSTTAVDALNVLRAAVQLSVALECPACG